MSFTGVFFLAQAEMVMMNFLKFKNSLIENVQAQTIMIEISALKVSKLGLSSQGKLRFDKSISSLDDVISAMNCHQSASKSFLLGLLHNQRCVVEFSLVFSFWANSYHVSGI